MKIVIHALSKINNRLYSFAILIYYEVSSNKYGIFVVSLTSTVDSLISKSSVVKMKPLVVLILTFIIALAVTYFIDQHANISLSGRIAMSIMLLFTSIGHFKFTKGMEMMLPDFIPAKKQMVLLTGFIEIAAAIGLLIPSTIKITGILLIVFFLLIMPANIYASSKKVNFEKANYNGNDAKYLWFRVPLQIVFIAWVYWFAIR